MACNVTFSLFKNDCDLLEIVGSFSNEYLIN